MFDFPIALATTNALLERIAIALERIAPPPLPSTPSAPYQAQLSDLRRISPETVQDIRDAEAKFAASIGVLPGTELFYAKVKEYEEIVREHYGEEGVSQLPWNIKS